MNFVSKCCQPPGILGDFAVDHWKFIDFTRPGILCPSPFTDKKWNSPLMPYDRNISGDILEIQDLQDNHASFTFLRHEISRIELNLVDGKDDDTEENL